MRGIERNIRKRKIKENFHSNNCLSSSPMFLIYKTCRNMFERFLNKVEITIFTLWNTFFSKCLLSVENEFKYDTSDHFVDKEETLLVG